MKKMFSIMLTIMLLLPVVLAEEAQNPLSYDQVKERMEANYYLNLVDIRSTEDYHTSHLPMAMNMPFDALQAEFQAVLDGGFSYMEAEIILYGEDEEQSRQAVDIVKSLGFTNVRYMAPFSAWPYKTLTTDEEYAQAQRLLGGMDAKDIYGNPVDESILSGHKLTMVNVWATYCNPCLDELPDLSRLAQDMKEKGVQIIGIVSDAMYDGGMGEENVQLAQEIASSTGADYLHIVPDAVISRKLLPQITSVPTTFFLDENGILAGYVYLGSRDYDAWKALLNETMAQLPEAAQ